MPPEQEARGEIDKLLTAAGWLVQPRDKVDLTVTQGIAICEYPLKKGHGFADYLLYVDGAAVGVIEAKKAGVPLTAVEIQTAKYSVGLPDHIPAPRRPLPFCYQSTGVETRFTNLLEPDARSRPVFAFHKPETFAQGIQADTRSPGSTVRGKLKIMPPLNEQGLWPAQKKAIRRLEESLADNRPRALIQMATGSGKTFTACNFVYRLIKFAGAKRILFLVDRKTLGRQTLNEFQQFVTPDDGRKFTELYNAQLLASNKIDTVSKVCVTTIQRLYSMLVGREIADDEQEERSAATWDQLTKLPEPITYNPTIPIETFDFIVTDECHRSIYNLWRQVLEYFDASLIGLTATPSRQTLGFFNQNLVMDYNHNQAVCGIIPSKGLDHRYLFFFLLSQRNDLLSKRIGGAQPNINQQVVRDLSVPVPPLDEQHRIVAEIEKQFTRLDIIIHTLGLVQKKLSMLSLLSFDAVQPMNRTGSGRTVRVGDVANSIQYGSSAKTHADSAGVPVLRMGNLTADGRILLGDLKYLPTTHPEFPTLLLKDGDVLFNRTNSAELVGKTAAYAGNPSPCSFASYLPDPRADWRAVPSKVFGYLAQFTLRPPLDQICGKSTGRAGER